MSADGTVSTVANANRPVLVPEDYDDEITEGDDAAVVENDLANDTHE